MRATCWLLVGVFTVVPVVAAFADGSNGDGRKYTLRYQFHPGETLRWEVEHRAKTRTTISGTTKTAETLSKSVKVWRVKTVDGDGSTTFENLVERVDMLQKMTGSPEVRYNSQTDEEPPAGFKHVADSIGVTLATVTMDTRGNIIRRVRPQVKAGTQSEGQMTIPLPDEPVPAGHTWSLPQEIDVKLNTGGIKKVKARQMFTLEGVKTGVATIRVATQILTPIDDPAVESQLIQRETTGTVRFDIDAGRVIAQQMDVDKRVVGFSGPASSIHYITRFNERLLPNVARTARRPDAKRR